MLNDASPGELNATLGLSTSLLAHHLKVLEEAGLVERARSEADLCPAGARRARRAETPQ